eukprot:COSAG02_NODE_66303_length_255_cov_21.250000_1_plen_57_part_10
MTDWGIATSLGLGTTPKERALTATLTDTQTHRHTDTQVDTYTQAHGSMRRERRGGAP